MIAAGALIVIETLTSPRSMPWNSVSMSSSVSTATPSRPTSPSDIAWSESWPISDGMSNAVLTGRSGRGRAGSGSARWSPPRVPKPANWRIVHSRPRYMLGYTPRVKGYWPGSPIWPPVGREVLLGVQRLDRVAGQRDERRRRARRRLVAALPLLAGGLLIRSGFGRHAGQVLDFQMVGLPRIVASEVPRHKVRPLRRAVLRICVCGAGAGIVRAPLSAATAGLVRGRGWRGAVAIPLWEERKSDSRPPPASGYARATAVEGRAAKASLPQRYGRPDPAGSVAGRGRRGDLEPPRCRGAGARTAPLPLTSPLSAAGAPHPRHRRLPRGRATEAARSAARWRSGASPSTTSSSHAMSGCSRTNGLNCQDVRAAVRSGPEAVTVAERP